MTHHLGYLLTGVGTGAAVALLALGLVLTWRSSGVVNVAHAAVGGFLAYCFYELRESGDLVLPVLGLPARVHLVPRPTVATALAVIVPYAALIGLAIYLVVFRWLRHKPPLSRVVASIGLFLYMWAIMRLRWPLPPVVRSILPTDTVRVAGVTLFADRLVNAAIAVVAIAALWAVYRFTRFGLATTAAAENEKGASLTGLDPNRLAAGNWMISTVLGALAVILIFHITSNDPVQIALLVVPALAAALAGGFRSFVWVGASGFAVGMVQGELFGVKASLGPLADVNVERALPLVIILVALVVRGRSLPTRGEPHASLLPRTPEPRRVAAWSAVVLAAGTALTLAGGTDARSAVINTAVTALAALSVVVLTGYIGQISLAPFAFAGVAAFSLSKLGRAGVPFPVAPLLAALIATAVGVVVGIPAVRVRGMNLAVATLGAAVAIEELVFRLGWFDGGSGAPVPDPKVGPVDLRVQVPGGTFPRPVFGIAVVVTVVVCGVAVANLRRGATGRAWLAVRANERAAAAAGVDVTRAKLTAFAASAFIAGIAGTLIAYKNRTLSADSFTVFLSLALLSITYLSGIASVNGALIAGLLAPLGVLTFVQHGGLPTEVSNNAFAINGLVLMAMAVIAPDGLVAIGPAVRARWARTRSARSRGTDSGDVTDRTDGAQRAVASA